MKKLIILSLIATLLPLTGFSQFTHLGISVGYASEVNEPGFGGYLIYRVNDQIKLTPNFQYFLTHELNTANGADISEGTQTFDWWMINLDGNYIILDQGVLEGYGIMGLNYSSVKWFRKETVLGQSEEEHRDTRKLGLNIGAGVRFNLGDKIVPFAELKYTLGGRSDFLVTEVNTSQFGIFAGLFLRISEDKERNQTEDY